jgi:hypothetical protein
MATIFGQEVFVRECTESTYNLGLKNFWTSGDDGDVLLYGYTLEFGFAYDPPILLIDAPLNVGKTWTQEFNVYMLPDTTFYDVWEITMEVVEEGLYEVGAGTFPGYGLNSYISMRANPMEGFSLTGQMADSDQKDPDYWFSDGVGQIQYHTDDFYMLESYFGGTTATESFAWDGVKALFR